MVGAPAVSRETPCSTWLRRPRLNSCVDSVALEQAASFLRASSENLVIPPPEHTVYPGLCATLSLRRGRATVCVASRFARHICSTFFATLPRSYASRETRRRAARSRLAARQAHATG